ncbi:MAG: TolC family protein [Acidobacteriia bacterium]|nr:TolC family protein [Terriglobia bacterium]
MAHIKNPLTCKLMTWGMWALLALPLSAQDKETPQLQPQGNPFTRIFSSNYATPAVRTIQVRGESLLDSMIKDGKLEISEQDAVNLALANNVDINVLRYTPYFQLWGIESGRAVLNPTVSFGPSLNRSVTPASSALQGGAPVLNLTSLYSLNVHKPFEPGLDFDFNFSATRGRTNSPFSSLNPSIASVWSIGATQHLLQGFGNISRARFLRVARNNYDISVENFSAGVINIVNNVLNTYWNLVFNDEDIKVKEASLKLAQLTLEQTQIQEQVGTMAPLDVLQAQAQAASVNQQLIVSRYNRRITEDQLKKLISSRSAAALIAATIVPTSRPLPPPAPAGSVTDATQRALEIRPEVKSQLLNQANNKIQVDYARNQIRPVLDLTVNYSQSGLGGDNIIRDFSQGFLNAPIIAITPGGFGDSLSSLFSGSYLGYAVGFNLKVPIGNDQARANSAQAQITYNQGEESLRSLRQQIILQVRQAYDSVALNQDSVAAAQVAVDYQEKRLQGEQDKYMLGASTTFLVVQAQRDLQNAQSVLLQAKIGWIQSRIALDQAVGDTLSVHNIVLDDALNLPKK